MKTLGYYFLAALLTSVPAAAEPPQITTPVAPERRPVEAPPRAQMGEIGEVTIIRQIDPPNGLPEKVIIPIPPKDSSSGPNSAAK